MFPTVRPDEDLYVASYDGSARVKRGGDAYSANLWKLPEWTVVKVGSGYGEGLTVNEAEYPSEINCKAPGLTLLRQKALAKLRILPDHELVHVKRDWNVSADSLASAALQRQCGVEIETVREIQDLITLNGLDEILIVKFKGSDRTDRDGHN
ncbi:reverse transcriptase [Phytophthora megakarya]|uniref:Reverse transcriptase n=1 Tax=Phytophthora megakarya TaxID=4795 RepID=A0A225W9L7_9STRA|nr:reverse transcriptase [Phytophthora megakarya]